MHNPRGFSGKENNTLVTQEHVQVSSFSFSGRIAIGPVAVFLKMGISVQYILIGKTGTYTTSRTHPTGGVWRAQNETEV